MTNDDGIDSLGLHVLVRHLAPLGDVIVAAPDKEYSGAGAALGTLHLLQPEIHRTTIDGADEAWAVTGPPALCVMFARLGAYGPRFDLVVSGINPGANAGRAVYHSGTVGAALTARNGGVSAVAISQAVTGFGIEGQGWDAVLAGQHWDTAAEVAAGVTRSLLGNLPDEPVVVNLNVPNCPRAEILGWRHAEVGQLPPRALSGATLEPKQGHEGTYHVRMEWGDPLPLAPETDGGAVEAGSVAVTYLTRITRDTRELPQVDRVLDELLA